MPLVAYRATTGEEIEAFSVEPAQWDRLRKEPLGAFLMAGTDWPAVLKRSIRGVQFFAHAPGYTGPKPEPESEHHRQAKIAVAKALRAAGYAAWVERAGSSPDGELWQADVLCQTDDRAIAFEVQLAQQTLDEYELRSSRYVRSGVKCVWLVREPKHYKALSHAIYYRYYPKGTYGVRPSHKDLAAFPLDLGQQESVDANQMLVMVIVDDMPKWLPLAEFAVGVADGLLMFSSGQWQWRVV